MVSLIGEKNIKNNDAVVTFAEELMWKLAWTKYPLPKDKLSFLELVLGEVESKWILAFMDKKSVVDGSVSVCHNF